MDEFLRELRQNVAGDVRADAMSRVLYSTDASIYQVMPLAVLIPRTVEDVVTAVSLAAQHHIPILPRGSGTSLAGQATNAALVLDTTRHLDHILELNVAEKWVRAESGVVLAHLNAHLKTHGLKFGPDPASANRATLGGVVGNNASGAHSILYGMAADHVLAAQMVLADGSLVGFAPENGAASVLAQKVAALVNHPANLDIIRQRTPRHWRRCGGYNLDRLTNGRDLTFQWPFDGRFNLAKLICGAEGTLGFMTEVTLNLVDAPTHTGLAILQFDEQRAALEAVPALLAVEPAAIEFLDHYGLSLAQGVPAFAGMMAGFVQGQPHCLLITEFYGASEREIAAKFARLRDHVRRRGLRPSAITTLTDPQAIGNVWRVREGGLGVLMSMRGDVKPLPFIEDAAVPVEHLADYIGRLEQFCRDELDTGMAYYAHASAGCLHVRPLINTKIAQDVAKLPQIMRFAVELLGDYGGVLSSEHGDGKARSWLNPRFFGQELYDLYRQVKGVFDPDNLFNPGNIVAGPAMTDNLRYGPDYRTIPIAALLDFRADQGFDRAVEMCNGAGVCRQQSGTMCPSFMATREEADSTRGRANALRAALAGGLPPGSLTGPDVYGVMDLCVSCKACQAECPSSVDMARIKAEFLHQYHQAHGWLLRDRFFVHAADLSRLASGRLAPLSNWALGSRRLRGALNRLLGLAARPFPLFAAQTFDRWYARLPKRAEDEARPSLILLVDMAHNYHEPAAAQAALKVLTAVGFQVICPPIHDFGRAAFSKGDLPRARRLALSALAALAPLAQAGWPIVGLEPSDVSMLLDDYAALLPDDGRVPLVAAQTVTFEELMWRQMGDGRLDGLFAPQTGRVLLHGHCHQKALGGVRASQELLAYLGYEVTEAGAACCGMAGSFGYEAEHEAISRQMGELRLLPAVRAQTMDTLIVAAGVSCREQIRQGAQRTALHPAAVLYSSLAG
ncbi:MAG: FAD-binding protein [Chloroflexi bacterium]|nr:FAD-binding protein [Chloroflexota bacterium]